MTRPALRRELGLRDLVLFHTTAILSVRWISYSAARGPSSLFLWGLALIAFFVPAAAAVIALTRECPEEGGIYAWTRRAFGPFHGFLCAWTYVVSNLVYFPSLLVTVAGYAAFTFSSRPAEIENDRLIVMAFALGAIALVTALSVLRVGLGKWLQNLGGVATWVPCGLLVALGLVSLVRSGSATALAGLVPNLRSMDTWQAWSQICFAFAGIELASAMSGEIRDPERTVPRSIYVAGVLIAALYALGTMSILIVLPATEVSGLTGIVQAIARVLATVGASALVPAVAALLTLGGLSAVGAWLAASARLPFVVGLDRFLPAALGRTHPRFGTPHVSILWQGALSSALVVLAFAGSTVSESYDLLVQSTTIVYFLPYLYLFGAHYRLAPEGRRRMARLLAPAGAAATLVAIGLAIVPPPGTRSPWLFEAKLLGSSVGLIAASLAFYLPARRRAKWERRVPS